MGEGKLALTIAKRFLDLGLFCLKIADEHNMESMRESARWCEEQAKLVQEKGTSALVRAHFTTIQDFETRIAPGVEEPLAGRLVEWRDLIKDAHTAASTNGTPFDVRGSLAEATDTIENAQAAMEAFTDAASRNRKSVATAATLMLIIITRAETLEHNLRLQALHLLEVAGRSTAVPETATAFVALGPLIPLTNRGKTEGRSELRVVRIAAAHAYYRVHQKGDDWRIAIQFPKNEFTKEYSRPEFEALVDRYYLFYQMLVAMLTAHELKVLIAGVLLGYVTKGGSERANPGGPA